MRVARLGSLQVRLVGGTDREGGGDGPVVVLLHGFGAPGDDLVPLWRVMDVPREVRFVFPAAPHELSMGLGESRAWWHLDTQKVEQALAQGVARDVSSERPEELDAALAAVDGMLAAVIDELRPSSLVLGGFSQGAMLSLGCALHTTRPLAGLILMSGALLDAYGWVPRMLARKGLPVLQSHGRADPLLSFEAAERLRDDLTGAGLEVTWIAHRGGHEIPPPVLDAAGAFITRVTRPAD